MTENRRTKYPAMNSDATTCVINPLDSMQIHDIAATERKAINAAEPLLKANPNRFVMFPIEHHDLFKKYNEHVSVFWRPEEIDLSKDSKDWAMLDSGEQHFIKRILGFFAGSDGIVMENISGNFATEIQIPEAKAFYAVQNMMESVHSVTYSLLIDTYIQDRNEKLDILRSIQTVPCIQRKADWALSWMSSDRADFPTRLMAFAAIEGVFFSGAFCSIFWLKQRGIMPGLTASNEFIARDEGLHTEFACLLYSKCVGRLSIDKAHRLIQEAVAIEKEFILEALPCSLIGMNAARMGEYIEFVADRLLVSLGYPRAWSTANPFPWMERISLEGKDNFFEKRVTNYSMADLAVAEFKLDEEF